MRSTPRGYRHGLVVGKFYPPHAGHHHLIDTASARCDRLTVVVAPSSGESIPLELRCAWLRARHPEAEIVGVYDDHPIDYTDPRVWDLHMAVFRSAVGTDRVDVVFSSEGYGAELARRFGAEHVGVDPGRVGVPVSGTAVRADPAGHWAYLSAPVRAYLVKRVIVVGAESTGTTTLARALAQHYDTRWVPEYGRELTAAKLAARKRADAGATVFDVTWDRADFVAVARAQNAAEDVAARESGPVLFGDTDARATAVWEERYLGSTSAVVAQLARDPALYLFTDHLGVPFEDDGLRDGEGVRGWMSNRFREVLAGTGVPVVALTGPPDIRLAAAVEAVDALLATGWSFTRPLLPGVVDDDARHLAS